MPFYSFFNLLFFYIYFQLVSTTQRKFVGIPDICGAFLYGGRMTLLKQTVNGFQMHMKKNEPWLSYEMITFINEGSIDEIQDIQSSMDNDMVIIQNRNYGLSLGFNTLFGACRARYIMCLEEDWAPYTTTFIPVLSMAIQIMENDESLVDISLRNLIDNKNVKRGAWMNLSTLVKKDKHLPNLFYNTFPYLNYQYIQYDLIPLGWGYTNGASLKHNDRLRKCGKQIGFDGEHAFTLNVYKTGYKNGMLCPTENQSFCNRDTNLDQLSEMSLFHHTGIKSRARGHNDVTKLQLEDPTFT